MIEKIKLSKIRYAREDGQLINPRGKLVNTTDLQDSMTQVGLQTPIQVVAKEDHYLVVDGHRRVKAARVLKWKEIDAQIVADPENLLVRMLASNVRKEFTPSQLGAAIRKLSQDKSWGIERTARLCGLKIDKAGLLIELLDAPEAVQKRVDKGELSLTAWKKLRKQPIATQMAAAKLEKPTIAAVKRLIRSEQTESMNSAMIDQLQPDNKPLLLANQLKACLMTCWASLSIGEQTRLEYTIEQLLCFMREGETSHA